MADSQKERNSRLSRGDELITTLKCILEDNSRILENQEEIKAMLSRTLPKNEPFVRC